MEKVINSTGFCQVRRTGNTLESSFCVLEPDLEAEVRVYADVSTLTIRKCEWETYKGNVGGAYGVQLIQKLVGKSAYINGKKDLNDLLKTYANGGLLKYMLIQCLNGIIQGETYFYKERGFSSEKAYEEYWDELEKDGCLMYSTKNERTKKWMVHAAPLERSHLLFNRGMSVEIRSFPRGRYQIIGLLHDSNHEISIELVISRISGCILDSEIHFMRAPDPVCMQNNKLEENLQGQCMKRLNKSKIVLLLGTSVGCYHLVDIMANILRLYRKCEGISE